MAEFRGANQARVSPDDVARWFAVILQIADAVLRLFGRRSTDRPERAEPEE